MTEEISGVIFGVWFLIGAALVFWMQAGFAMVGWRVYFWMRAMDAGRFCYGRSRFYQSKEYR